MSTVIEKFVSEWELKVDQNSIDRGQNAINAISKGLLGLVAAGAAAAVGLAVVVNKIAGETDAVGKRARDFGASTEEFQKLETAAGLAGLKFEAVAGAVGKLSKNADDAINGSKSMRDAFSDLNIKVSDFTKLTPTEKLLSISDSLANIENPSKRAALRMTLMGRAGSKMGSLLDGGRKALQEMIDVQEKFGVLISPEDLAQSERYNDSLLKVAKFTKGIAQTLTNTLLPAINPLLDRLLEWIKSNKDLVNSKVEKFTKAFSKALEFSAKAATKLYDFTKKLTDSVGGFDNAMRLAAISMAVVSIAAGAFIAINYGAAIAAAAVSFIRLAGSALLANASVLLIPLAIGALITLVGLLVDDFISFKNGQDSIIGRLVDKYTWFAQVVGFLSQVAEDVGRTFGIMGDFIVDKFTNVFDWLDDKTSGFATVVVSSLKKAAQSIGKVIGPVLKVAARIVGYDDATISDINTLISGNFDFGNAKPSPRQQKLNAAEINVNSNTNINIVTQPGQDNESIGRMVDQKLDARDRDNSRAIEIATNKGVKR